MSPAQALLIRWTTGASVTRAQCSSVVVRCEGLAGALPMSWPPPMSSNISTSAGPMPNSAHSQAFGGTTSSGWLERNERPAPAHLTGPPRQRHKTAVRHLRLRGLQHLARRCSARAVLRACRCRPRPQVPAVRQQIHQLAELLRSGNGQTLSALIVAAQHDQVRRAAIGQRWMAQRRRRGLKRTWAAVKARECVDGLRVVSVPEALYTSSV